LLVGKEVLQKLTVVPQDILRSTNIPYCFSGASTTEMETHFGPFLFEIKIYMYI